MSVSSLPPELHPSHFDQLLRKCRKQAKCPPCMVYQVSLLDQNGRPRRTQIL